jgi:hypothetical protein
MISASLKAQLKVNSSKAKTYKILFVGNSLTYSNNLPLLVSQAASHEKINLSTEMLAKPNYALIDHWEEGELQAKINSKSFDFVIVQQGPSSQAEGRALLLQYGKRIAALCKTNKTQLVFFMVWPSLQYYQTFDGVIKTYREAALENDALLCPVGEVWQSHFEETENFDYYGSDGFHPSLKGSRVAADLIVSTLFTK